VIIAKLLGCGLPTLLFNFNFRGMMRIGLGMAPRGEVAFIVAGVGLSQNILVAKYFGAGIMMILLVDFISAPIVNMIYKGDEKGTKKTFNVRETVTTPVDFASRSLTELVEQRLIRAFRAEGFFAHAIVIDRRNIYHLRKNETLITIHSRDKGLEFESDPKDVIFIKTIAYETLLQINDIIVNVKDIIKPESLQLQEELTDTKWRNQADIKKALSQGSIIPRITATTKQGIVEQLVGILHSEGLVKNSADAVKAVMEREASMSTGMQHGIALPHARTDTVDKVTIAVGLASDGIDYQSLDGEPSKIFVLILSPQSSESSHIQVLANISALLNSSEMRSKLLLCRTQGDIYNFFNIGLGD
jgi:fructose-specific phosphotransferase system IIA component